MYIFFSILFCIFTTSSTMLGSQKLTLQHLNVKTISLDQLDTTLKARPWTKVDQLNEDLEDVALTTEQKTALDEINRRQNEIVIAYKNIYAPLIQEQIQNERFDRNSIILNTINDYKKALKLRINTELKHQIINLLNSIPDDNPTKENIPDARRRQRE